MDVVPMVCTEDAAIQCLETYVTVCNELFDNDEAR